MANLDSDLGARGTTLGHYLKDERLSRGLSRAALSRAAQIDSARLEKFESNVAVPNYAELSRLGAALGIASETLLSTGGYIGARRGG